mgnify:CR=1 FL=1
MDIISLSLMLGIVIGALSGAVMLFVVRGKWKEKNLMLSKQVDDLAGEKNSLAEENNAQEQKINSLMEEKTRLVSRAEVLNNKVETLDEQIAAERENNRLNVKKMEEHMKVRIEEERTHSKQLRDENDRQWNEKFETLKQEMQKTAAEQLTQRQASLQETNRTQMDELLKPIKEQFEAFKKSVDESKTSGEVNKTEIKNTFELMMQNFVKTQADTVKSLKEQTEKIGNDAVNLTKALKGESKTQGDWGEMVLETLLEGSGLHKDEEFFVQQNVKDEEGRNLRPDVVVRFPEGRSVVIDSKVSLTAYANAVAADTDEKREQFLKEHVKSMMKHIDELAGKNYDKTVSEAIGFVLMFVPNENSYIAAMRQKPDLGQYAYKKKVIVISPTNLQITLQLAYNLWQIDRQSKNVEKIVKAATDLYDKVAGMSETFEDIGTQINRLNDTYVKAQNQLYNGKGNVMNRLENLKKMGVTPKKQIKGLEEN